ncbi:MAG: DUF4338 domain-containing protein [Clostridia bacterium]|nr:MAG: DUF4338 domain-containing protein [Clostridia bacterium]
MFIGWTPAQREQRLHLVVNQARFLILPYAYPLGAIRPGQCILCRR